MHQCTRFLPGEFHFMYDTIKTLDGYKNTVWSDESWFPTSVQRKHKYLCPSFQVSTMQAADFGVVFSIELNAKICMIIISNSSSKVYHLMVAN